MNKVLFLLTFLIAGFGVYSFKSAADMALPPNVEDAPGKINWLTWEQALQKSKIQKKKLLVDVYTDWCGWCKRMDAATFQQEHIAKYVNEHYYAIKFDAEQKEDIVFNGKSYKFVKNGKRGYHELAAEITRGRLSYPTIVFLDENQSVIQPVPGYKSPEQFEQIITYFARNEHLKTPWESYQKAYQPLTKED